MKLKLPGDITGGLAIFAIMFAIAVIEIYFAKKVGFLAGRWDTGGSGTHLHRVCKAAGGEWNWQRSDPCCWRPSQPKKVPLTMAICNKATGKLRSLGVPFP